MANREAGIAGWNMDNLAGARSDQEGVDIKDWDPSDPQKKKIKATRKFSFD
jgi:hypothetical protein